MARFDGHVGAVTAISFSENGYFLAVCVKLLQLRVMFNFDITATNKYLNCRLQLMME